jgi:hypothetical protein
MDGEGNTIDNFEDFIIRFAGDKDGQDVDPDIIMDELREQITI